MFCPKCGVENIEGSNMCRGCGWILTGTGPAAAAVAAKTSGLAIASMVLGILSFFTFILTGLPAIVLGIISLVQISRNKGQLKGAGFAITGIVTPLVAVFFMVGFVAFNMVGRIDKAKVTATKTNLKMLHIAVIQFKLDTGRYPTEDGGLQELVEEPTDVTGWNQGGYLETNQIPKDAWGNDFVYQLYPENGKPFVIISYGADGEEGGEGYDADLYSTDQE